MATSFSDFAMELVEAYKDLFQKMEGDDFLFHIGKFVSVVECFQIIYSILLKQGLLEPIESLTLAQKNELWKEAKRISVNQDNEHLIKVSKAIHAFGSYLQV